MSLTALSPEETAAIRRLRESWPRPEAAAVDALYLAQATRGWIDDERLEAVAELLGLSPAYLDSLATCYPPAPPPPGGPHGNPLLRQRLLLADGGRGTGRFPAPAPRHRRWGDHA